MELLKDQLILLLAPKFFGYENMIKQALEQEGAIVHLYDERPDPSSIEKILIRKARLTMHGRIRRYYNSIVKQESLVSFDYILFINPEAVDGVILKEIRASQPKAKLILYMWDSSKNKRIKQYFGLFDKLYSFDMQDCDSFGMTLRPLFFSNEIKRKYSVGNAKNSEDALEAEYDISFVGTVHSDRAKIITEIMSFCDKHSISYFFYLYVPGKLMYILRWLTDGSLRRMDKSYVHIKPMNKKEYLDVMESTRCVLDINHPKQTGLTMRTIEMVGMRRKIMTTNREIEKYDFYIPGNQIALDRKKIYFNIEALQQAYIDIPSELYEKYSIQGWIKDVFNL